MRGRRAGSRRRFGSYASGFGGGLVLTIAALAVSRRPGTPAPISLIPPGFWLLVPGSLGLMGITQMLGMDSMTVFTATLISMISIARGVHSGLLVWRAFGLRTGGAFEKR
jgi:uncharacterized membrane protein YjjB (DUF3815 family)